jgi:hypothetical protein
MVTPGFLPSRGTRASLHNVGEGREQDAEASFLAMTIKVNSFDA